ncbi:MAG TPA: FAD-dependent monooxygenase [Anaeromyxobacteraceae bacterium]|nr:FAD-dependent monooxygenase [Anaeromyxobacteraceae bacterium]
MRCDLLIVGAGPAGCAAAVAARRAEPRLKVAVIDAHRFPREKLCGGAITGGGLRELELGGLALRVPHVVASHAALRAGGHTTRLELSRPAVVVCRADFDADLVAQARAAGAQVLEEIALQAVEGAVAVTAQGAIRFRALIGADGVSGASRRALGLPLGRLVPLRKRLLASAGQRDLFFDLEAGLPGYVWRFPCLHGGRVCESLGAYSFGRSIDLDGVLARYADREGLPTGQTGYGAIRVFEPGGPVGKGNAVLVGEALGIDPLAGEGIRYALWSGRTAGRLVAWALARGDTLSLEAYRRQLFLSRSGVLLELGTRLASRLYGPDPRWCRAAADRRVAGRIAALVSGELPALPLLWLLGRLSAVAARRVSTIVASSAGSAGRLRRKSRRTE